MKKFISTAIFICAFSQVAIADLIQEGDPVTSWDGKYTLFRLEENGIHYHFIYGPFDDVNGNGLSTYQFYQMYHDEDVLIPDRVDIPAEFVWDGRLRKVKGIIANAPSFKDVKVNFSDKELTFDKVYFPKDVYPPCIKDMHGEHKAISFFSPFTSSVNVSEFIIDEDNPVFKSADGVLMSKEEDIIIRYPICKKVVNYYVPESIKALTKGCFLGIRVPVFLNKICEETPYDPAFKNYPFFGLYDNTGVLDRCVYMRESEIKALDHADIEAYPKNAVAISFLPYEVGMTVDSGASDLVFEKYIFSNIFNTPHSSGIVRTVEFTYPEDALIRIIKDMDDWDNAIFLEDPDMNKVTTYVNGSLLQRFENMYETQNFPQNAVIEPTKDMLYLYPELCNGIWVNNQTQFVYGLCRLGDSQLVSRKWDTDNHNVATIDDSGLLTAYQTGTINITLICTDTEGNEYGASKQINISEDDLKVTSISDTIISPKYPRGIYTVLGLHVGDNTEGLTKGIYISEGKKIAIR